jgi:predicted DNA-binding protein (MmcQ/YjbR family)
MNKDSADEINNFINTLKNVEKTNPFEKNIDVYNINSEMFALIKNKNPMIISLRCDKQLSEFLQTKYESVMPGQKLDPDKWISIVNSGQIPETEIEDLIVLSYNLAKKSA